MGYIQKYKIVNNYKFTKKVSFDYLTNIRLSKILFYHLWSNVRNLPLERSGSNSKFTVLDHSKNYLVKKKGKLLKKLFSSLNTIYFSIWDYKKVIL